MLTRDAYLLLRERPPGRPAMYQRWRDLTFLHASYDPTEIQRLLPAGLTVDTFPGPDGRERAWVGLVHFWMLRIRTRGLPPIPGLHTFPETNVRTYVHRDGKEPGVWFFSLDAASRFACAWARRFFSLPYFWSRMYVHKSGASLTYTSDRLIPRNATTAVKSKIGPALIPPQPGSLEFFLVERYLLYANRRGRLHTGRVAHPPYPLHAATLQACDESMLQAAGIPPKPWEHILYSPGVDVAVYPLEPPES